MVQVFGENSLCAALDGGGNNQGVPEVDLGFILDTKSLLDLLWGGRDAPVSKVVDRCSSFVSRQRVRQFSGYVTDVTQ